MNVGTEWLIDASGCDPELLRDAPSLRRMFDCIIRDLDLQVVGEQLWHSFPPPGGVTGIALLTESHLACHTYPEFGTATVNLYCCRERTEWNWEERLKEILHAQSVIVRVIQRVAIDQHPTQARDKEAATSSAGGRQ